MKNFKLLHFVANRWMCFISAFWFCMYSCNEANQIDHNSYKSKEDNFFFLSFEHGMDSLEFKKNVDSLLRDGKLLEEKTFNLGASFPMKILDTIFLFPISPEFYDNKLHGLRLEMISRVSNIKYVDEIEKLYKLKYGEPDNTVSREFSYAILNDKEPLTVRKGNMEAEKRLDLSKDKIITEKSFDTIMVWNNSQKTIEITKTNGVVLLQNVYEDEIHRFMNPELAKKSKNGKLLWEKVNETYFHVNIKYLSKQYSDEINRQLKISNEAESKQKEKEKKFIEEFKNEI